MPDDEAEEILSGTVEEVKEQIRDMEDPDYENLLEKEKDGKDRKTVKEFLESRLPGDGENAEEPATEPEEPSGDDSGFLEQLSRPQVLATGAVIGLLVGGVLAFGAGQAAAGPSASPQSVADNVRKLVGQSPNRTVDVGRAEMRHGMYYFNVSITDSSGNGTTTSYQELYVSSDGELLFPKVRSFLITSPIKVDQALQQRANATR